MALSIACRAAFLTFSFSSLQRRLSMEKTPSLSDKPGDKDSPSMNANVTSIFNSLFPTKFYVGMCK